jgi:cobalt-precorrin 5A hydrolase
MVGDKAVIVAGIGFRTCCEAAEIVALVRRAEAEAGCKAGCLAMPVFKQDETAPAVAAQELGLELRLIPRDALEAVQHVCPSRSEASLAAIGLASVAEACALAAVGPSGRILLPKIVGAGVTCALAASGDAAPTQPEPA